MMDCLFDLLMEEKAALAVVTFFENTNLSKRSTTIQTAKVEAESNLMKARYAIQEYFENLGFTVEEDKS